MVRSWRPLRSILVRVLSLLRSVFLLVPSFSASADLAGCGERIMVPIHCHRPPISRWCAVLISRSSRSDRTIICFLLAAIRSMLTFPRPFLPFFSFILLFVSLLRVDICAYMRRCPIVSLIVCAYSRRSRCVLPLEHVFMRLTSFTLSSHALLRRMRDQSLPSRPSLCRPSRTCPSSPCVPLSAPQRRRRR